MSQILVRIGWFVGSARYTKQYIHVHDTALKLAAPLSYYCPAAALRRGRRDPVRRRERARRGRGGHRERDGVQGDGGTGRRVDPR